MLWFKNHGFYVTGFERSDGLARLARQHSGCDVIEGDFNTFDFTSLPCDAILLTGSLVHVPHDTLQLAIKNVTAGLRPGGKLLISLKQGNGTVTDKRGRRFYFWQTYALEDMFPRLGFSVLEFNQQVSKVNHNDVWLAYVLENGAPENR